tara:strand:+ start:245 stop:1186 length:942 start_codon:yes stop_codon:yes gene_type:complete
MVQTKNLITGGAGFLGSNLIEKLIRNKEYVICLDNCFTGRKSNIRKFLDSKYFEFIEHDVLDPINLKVDKIWHLACPASPKNYQKDPIRTLRTSFIGTSNMLELALKEKARILLASTSEIYGDPKIHPQTENYNGNVNTTGIRSCYDEGKRAAETLCFDYCRTKNVDVRIVRIFNTYGPYMQPDDGRVVSNFIVQALENKAITIYGDGNQTRSFCYVDDLIEAMILTMNKDHKMPINIGNPNEFTINQLAYIIQKKISNDLKIVYKPLPEDDPIQRCPDISKAKKLLGWEAKISLEVGLDKTIDYFRSLYGNQ